jgi:7-cyano-7-deazaguanine synthase
VFVVRSTQVAKMVSMSTSPTMPLAADDPGALSRVSELAILSSGGLDSAILLGEASAREIIVHPLYVCAGHPWEESEIGMLRRLLAELGSDNLQDLVLLKMPVDDLYGDHWSLTGRAVPDEKSADQAVFLPGRNVLLLAKGMLWCHLNKVPALAQAVLSGNPFPDATDSFYQRFEEVMNQAIDGSVRVLRPYARLKKLEIMERGGLAPLKWSFSCIKPCHGKHCGRCNKCAERQKAFKDARLDDPTAYSAEDACTA